MCTHSVKWVSNVVKHFMPLEVLCLFLFFRRESILPVFVCRSESFGYFKSAAVIFICNDQVDQVHWQSERGRLNKVYYLSITLTAFAFKGLIHL